MNFCGWLRNPAPPISDGWNPNKIMGCLPSINWCRISQPSTVTCSNDLDDLGYPYFSKYPYKKNTWLQSAWNATLRYPGRLATYVLSARHCGFLHFIVSTTKHHGVNIENDVENLWFCWEKKLQWVFHIYVMLQESNCQHLPPRLSSPKLCRWPPPFCQVSAVPFTRGVFAPQGVVGAITSSANEIGGGRVDRVHLSTII